MADWKEDAYLDAKNLACPMPIVKLKKAIDGLQPGQILKMEATDPGSIPDVKAWSERTGHPVLSAEQQGKVFVFYVKHS
jgi:TusA-related sulfurtransferase